MEDKIINLEHVGVTAQGAASQGTQRAPTIAPYIERGFRWIRETVSLIYAHHQHPLPMVALIFMYAETLGKPLAAQQKKAQTTKTKVSLFVQKCLPKLWAALAAFDNREDILSDYYRNGLVHEMFMKQDAGIHEDKSGDSSYVSTGFPGIPVSINIDRLVPEFLDGIAAYYNQLLTDRAFLDCFAQELSAAREKPNGH